MKDKDGFSVTLIFTEFKSKQRGALNGSCR